MIPVLKATGCRSGLKGVGFLYFLRRIIIAGNRLFTNPDATMTCVHSARHQGVKKDVQVQKASNCFTDSPFFSIKAPNTTLILMRYISTCYIVFVQFFLTRLKLAYY
jgi:hypothetical protein